MAKAGDQYEIRTGNIWNFAHRDDVVTCRRLVSEGVPAMLCNKVGWTPLHAAAFGGAERVISFLVRESFVDIDPLCRAGRTPLMDAARGGHLAAVKALVKAGANLHLSDPQGFGLAELAKGEAVRGWLAQRLSPDVAPIGRSPRGGGRGGGGGGGGGGAYAAPKMEAKAERQKIGASSKQKAARLKQKRAETQALAREAARGSAHGRSAERAGEAAAAERAAAERAAAAEGSEANGAPCSPLVAEAAGGDEASDEDEGGVISLDDPPAAALRATPAEATSASAAAAVSEAHAAAEAPPGPDATLEQRRAYAYAPLRLSARGAAEGVVATAGRRPGSSPCSSDFCLQMGALSAAALETAASFACASGAAAAAATATTRHIACIVADARHPWLYASPAVYAALRSRLGEAAGLDHHGLGHGLGGRAAGAAAEMAVISPLGTAPPPSLGEMASIVIVLTKADLVPPAHLNEWTKRLRRCYPASPVIAFR